MEEGSSAADCVTDVTDVTDRGPMAVGSSATDCVTDVTDRRKKGNAAAVRVSAIKNVLTVWAVAIGKTAF